MTTSTTSLTSHPAGTRVAITTRYSSVMQRPASSQDQEESCREAAKQKGWVLMDDYVRHDSAKTGTSKHRRPGLDSLIEAAKETPRPFDIIMADDTSRIGRDLGNVLTLQSQLAHYGVGLYFVSQRLDSRDENFRTMLTFFGMADEQFVERLAKRVHAGQKSRVRQGFSSGSKCYGYRSVVVPDPSRPGESGRAATLGTRWEIIEVEATIIRRIFESFANGMSVNAIGSMLEKEGIPGARHGKIGTPLQPWNSTLVKRILHNEKYIGTIRWNRTKQLENPETGQIVTRKKPEAEEVTVDAPHLRIVSDELWQRVRDRFIVVNEELKNYRWGGHQRAKKVYVFSGLLKCGLCGNKILISGGKNTEAAFQCTSARHNRGCENRLRIREDRLTAQLIEALQTVIFNPDHLEDLIRTVLNQVEEHYRQLRAGSNDVPLEDLKRDRAQQQTKINNLYDAIENTSPEFNTGLIGRLSTAQHNVKDLDRRIATIEQPPQSTVTVDQLRSLVMQNVEDLETICLSDKTKARQIAQMYIKELILYPTTTDAGYAFEVIGGLRLFEKDRDSNVGVLLDRPITATIQKYTSYGYLFAGLRLRVNADRLDRKELRGSRSSGSLDPGSPDSQHCKPAPQLTTLN